jgi:hypothetical protein
LAFFDFREDFFEDFLRLRPPDEPDLLVPLPSELASLNSSSELELEELSDGSDEGGVVTCAELRIAC